MVVLVALLALGLVLTGPIVDAIAGPVGIGSTAVTLWNVAKWPVMAGVFILMLSVLYYASPNAKLRGFRWVTPGSLVAIVVWAIASAAFALYVANFGSYDKTYGTLGGLIVLLVWLWITNIAILFGHALNAQLEREQTPRSSFELNAGRSSGLRLLTRRSSTQTSSSTHSAPALRRSVFRLGHEVILRPSTTSASISVHGPWQMTPTGLSASKNSRTNPTASGSCAAGPGWRRRREAPARRSRRLRLADRPVGRRRCRPCRGG